MGYPFQNPYGLTSGRKVNTDGTIDIKCRICAKTICREPYRRFSTAICATCNGDIAMGYNPEEILQRALAGEQAVVDETFQDIGPGNFKASGIKQRIRDVVEKVKKAAVGRRRSPLLSKKDKI